MQYTSARTITILLPINDKFLENWENPCSHMSISLPISVETKRVQVVKVFLFNKFCTFKVHTKFFWQRCIIIWDYSWFQITTTHVSCKFDKCSPNCVLKCKKSRQNVIMASLLNINVTDDHKNMGKFPRELSRIQPWIGLALGSGFLYKLKIVPLNSLLRLLIGSSNEEFKLVV